MSVSIRGKKFHYRFVLQGKSYSGPCPGSNIPDGATPQQIAAIKKAAVQFEDKLRRDTEEEVMTLSEADREIRKNKSILALVENYKFELTGGTPITFREAFALAVAKPSRKKAASNFVTLRKTYWGDFASFMEATFPDVQELSAVRRSHCEAYVAYLAEHGRFDPSVSYDRQGAKRKKSMTVSYVPQNTGLSHKTIKAIIGVCKWVFSRLSEDAGIFQDPWKNVILPVGETINREVFTPKELLAIWQGMQSDPFCYHLFLIVANSGMTEGDICTLKWEDVDWDTNCICRERRKTKASIVLPMLPQLREYLLSLPRTGEYISPAHARMYLDMPSYVSQKVTKFLRSLGIETTVKIEGRRARSVKDLHSMRHVFCYKAKRAGIPESSIQRFVGHEVLAMTQHYADHDTIADLAEDIKKLPSVFAIPEGDRGGTPLLADGSSSRQKLADLAYSLPLEQVERLLELAASVSVTA